MHVNMEEPGYSWIFHIQESKPLILNLTKRIGQNPAPSVVGQVLRQSGLSDILNLGCQKELTDPACNDPFLGAGGLALNINPYSMFLCTLLSEFCGIHISGQFSPHLLLMKSPFRRVDSNLWM